MQADQLQKMIRRILFEELLKKNAIGGESVARVPEMDANGIDPEKKPKTPGSDHNIRDVKSKDDMQADLSAVVSAIDKNISVDWNDHDDLMVNARDLRFIRISPRWEDYYVIEMMTRNEDRIWVAGQTWAQVKEFVKLNLRSLNTQPTAVETAYDKSRRNREDQTTSSDKGMPQKDKPSIRPLTNEQSKTSSKKDKNYTEKPKDDGDLPTKPMKEVGSFKRQEEYVSRGASAIRKEKTKFPEKKPNTTLTVKVGSQDTTKFRK